MLQTLLLNSTGECLSFISERKLLKLWAAGKINILSSWNQTTIKGVNVSLSHPAVVQLCYRVPWIPKKRRFNRYGVFRRDKYTCQYCGTELPPSKLTLDHIIPRESGGGNSWKNCVAACKECNNRKGARIPSQAGMSLLLEPKIPIMAASEDFPFISIKHPDWNFYLGEIP